MDELLNGLKAVAEPTRLRLLAILARSDLTVTELTQIARQSQPRVSRHLKLLCEAGLLERYREGSWVFYRIAEAGTGAALAKTLLELLPPSDATLQRDRERLEAVRAARAEKARAYFSANAGDWDQIRALYIPETEVEAALISLAGEGDIDRFVDLGTGTGRILEVFSSLVANGLGIDLSPEMLNVARANLERKGIRHCHVRQGDLFDLPLQDHEADLVCLHQVLHYLEDPAGAIAEAARILKPGGKLLIADFAPHELDFLREQHAHRRLGFATDDMAHWLHQAGFGAIETRELTPQSEEAHPLTILVWAAELGAATRPRTSSPKSKPKLERISP